MLKADREQLRLSVCDFLNLSRGADVICVAGSSDESVARFLLNSKNARYEAYCSFGRAPFLEFVVLVCEADQEQIDRFTGLENGSQFFGHIVIDEAEVRLVYRQTVCAPLDVRALHCLFDQIETEVEYMAGFFRALLPFGSSEPENRLYFLPRQGTA